MTDQQRIDAMTERAERLLRRRQLRTPQWRLATRLLKDYARP